MAWLQWRKLGERVLDVPRRDRMVVEATVAAGDMSEWRGLTQGKFLGTVRETTERRYDAAVYIQKCSRSIRPRKLLLQAQARRLQEEMQDNVRLAAVALKIMQRMSMVVVFRCFESWSIWAYKMMSARELMRKFATGMQNRCLHAWILLRKDGIAYRKQLESSARMVVRMLKQHQAVCLERWHDWTSKVNLARDMADRLVQNSLRSRWRYWQDELQKQQDSDNRKLKAGQFVVRMQMQAAAKCFTKWSEWSYRCCCVKDLVRKHMAGLAQECFDAWVYCRNERLHKNQQVATAAKMVARMTNQASATCFGLWNGWTGRVRAAKQMAKRLQGGYNRVCLYEWMGYVHDRKVKAKKLALAKKFLAESVNDIALECVVRWADWRRKMESARVMLAKIRGNALAEVMFCWHDWTLDRKQWSVEFEKRARWLCRKRLMKLSRQCWVAWRQRAYTTWLSNDYWKHLSRRRRREELQAWFLWARAVRRAETGFRVRQRNMMRNTVQFWRRWALALYTNRTEINRKLRREVEKAQTAAVIAAHHLERRMQDGAADYREQQRQNGSTSHRSGSSSARQAHLAGMQGQVAALGDFSEDVEHVLELQKVAELCQNHLEQARQGVVKPKAALVTLHSLTGSPPKRQAVQQLPPVSTADRWRPTPRGSARSAKKNAKKSAALKYLVPEPEPAQYTILAKKAVVRVSADPESAMIEELSFGAVVTGFEARVVDGHTRVRVGEDRWVSRVTAKGKVLLEEMASQE